MPEQLLTSGDDPMDRTRTHNNPHLSALFLMALAMIPGAVHAMNSNLAWPWGDRCSPPQTPYLSFSSPQSEDLLFTTAKTIELRCQAGLRAVNLRWSLHRNRITTPFRNGLAEASAGNRFVIRLDTAGLHPGFYDVKVALDTGMTNEERDNLNKRPVTGVCTFGWRVDEMAIADTRPADFTAFWAKARAGLAGVALDAREEPMQSFGRGEIGAYNVAGACLPPDYDPEGHRAETVESCKVSFAGPDGGRVYGWLAKPPGDGPFPVMLVLPGAGFNARPRPLEHARHGYLAMDIQIHGQDVDLPKYPQLPGYYQDQTYEPASAFYFYNVHLRCVQALNYLLSRRDADPKRVAVVGGSQGGRLGVVLAGLDPRVKAVVSTLANAPNQPHLRWVARCNGFANLGDKKPDPTIPLSDGMDRTGPPSVISDAASRCLAYYDPMNFAPDITCPVLMQAGLIDPVSPPFSPWAVYNRLGTTTKTMVAIDGHAHDWSAAFDRRAWRWLDAVLDIEQSKSSPQHEHQTEDLAMKIVCLGDSITGQPNLRRYLKWSSVLDCMFEAACGEQAVEVVNRGIGGDTTGGALKRLQGDVLDERPDIVVVMLGGNDAGAKRSPEEVRTNLEEIVRKCKGVGAKVLLLQYHVLPNPDSPDTAWAHLDDNNAVIAQVAATENVPFLNMAEHMQSALAKRRVGELQGRDKAGVASWRDRPMTQEHLASAQDGVHLNPGGELVFARAIYAKLMSLGWLKR
jgi:cephalosporin-C deacetylase-like acetyl esterase/lysophospholipase L1-like esterase